MKLGEEQQGDHHAGEPGDGGDRESAFWSESSGFATVLVEILTGWIESSVK